MRPTFAVPLRLEADDAICRIEKEVKSAELGGRVISAGRCAEFSVAKSECRVWSPHLSIQLEEAEEGCVLHGRFAPRPEVWTFLMFLYFTMVFIVFIGGVYGYAQWVIGQRPWALVAVPAGLLLIGALHAASLVGQRLAHDQMERLHTNLNTVLDAAFPEGREASEAARS
jgi:hypothetical protein